MPTIHPSQYRRGQQVLYRQGVQVRAADRSVQEFQTNFVGEGATAVQDISEVPLHRIAQLSKILMILDTYLIVLPYFFGHLSYLTMNWQL